MSLEVQRQKILETFGKTEKDLAEDVELIKNWFKTQPHLPEIPSDHMISVFLVMNKFSLEKVKKALDMYYTIRKFLPNIFAISNPKTPQMKACSEIVYTFSLPKLVDGMYQVNIFKQREYIPPDFDPDWWTAASVVHILEVSFRESLFLGVIIIYDQQHLRMDHITRVTPMYIKNTLALFEKLVNNRIREIHVINYPPFLDIILKLCKPVMKPKLFNRIKLHQSVESLREYVPLDILPKDYGGNEKSLEELHEDWKEKLNKYQDRFDLLDTFQVNESLRPTPMEDTESFGIQGTFKKLNVD